MRTALSILLVFLLSSCTKEKPEAKKVDAKANQSGQYVYFKNLADGDVVKSPVKIEMGVVGMEVEPLGPINKNKGHHHLLIDSTFVQEGIIIPTTARSMHFGKGQLETELELEPGKRTLTLQFGDGVHRSYGEGMSKTITITVE